jgi:hypothetical protein
MRYGCGETATERRERRIRWNCRKWDRERERETVFVCVCEWVRTESHAEEYPRYVYEGACSKYVFLFLSPPNWIYLPDTMPHYRASRWIHRPSRFIVCLITLAQLCRTPVLLHIGRQFIWVRGR